MEKNIVKKNILGLILVVKVWFNSGKYCFKVKARLFF